MVVDAGPPAPMRAASPAPSVVVKAPPTSRALLGRVPTTSLYRVIGCAPDQPGQACDRALDGAVGEEVDFGGGLRGKVTGVAELIDGAGDKVRAYRIEPPLDQVAGYPAGAAGVAKSPASRTALDEATWRSIESRHRGYAPRAAWATRHAFRVEAIQSDLDGDGTPDRLALSTFEQTRGSESAVTRVLWVSMGNGRFEPVDFFPVWSVDLAGTVDLDGDGAQEVLMIRSEATGAPSLAMDYEYRLLRTLPGRPLATIPGKPSQGWVVAAELEDHDHSDE
ncbi:MAG: VCBS repeat-containing protein [Deltaproteobacteria bacterium]|nr:VCBS repeat-containing protein [Deltaproteobacteria bacterium]